jgi:hypothetical protein
MGHWMFLIAQFAVFLFAFLMALYFLLPKAVFFYSLWKKTEKSVYLSASASLYIAAFFFYSHWISLYSLKSSLKDLYVQANFCRSFVVIAMRAP